MERREESALNWLRALFAFLVLLAHVRKQFLLPYGEVEVRDFDILLRGFYFVTGFGSASVVGFFVLSGYLITRHYSGSLLSGSITPGAFLLSRGIRIYTVLLPVLIGSWLLVTLSPLSEDCSWRSFFAALFLLQPLNPPAFGGNAPLWSLGYEAWCYVIFCGIFAGIGLFRRARRRPALLWSLVGVLPLALFPVWMAHYLALWSLGAVAARIQSPECDSLGGKRRARVYKHLALVCSVAGFFLARSGFPSVARDYVVAVPLAVCLALLSNVATERRGRAARLGAKLAEFSYSLYLTHYPLVLLAGVFWGAAQPPSTRSFVWTGAVTVICLLFGYLFSLQTERRTSALRTWAFGKLGARA